MEDGIESNRTTLYDRLEEEKKYMYIYIGNNFIDDIFITHNKNNAIKYSNENKCIIQIFKCDQNDKFIPSGKVILPQ